MKCFVSMESNYFLCTCMFFSITDINSCRLTFYQYSNIGFLWLYNDLFQATLLIRTCLPISTIADFWRAENIYNIFEVFFILYNAICTCNNSVIMVSCLESSGPFLQIIIYNFSGIVSAIYLNSSAEMYSISEGEYC